MLSRLWQGSPELVATAAVMLVVLAGAVVGLAVDPTIITGAPAWLKPAKFAISIAVYTLTLAWIFTLIPEWVRTRRAIGWVTAVTMVLEIAVISLQAYRGRPSHFNVSTPLDGALFTIMGMAIVIQTISTVAVAVAVWRHRFEDVALGWAVRFGIVLTIVGAFTGGLMTRPTSAQLAAARAGEPMTLAGAHTVGAADGGSGLPGTGWSTEHGDLRVPHFVGLHAMQALPILALFLRRTRIGRRTAAGLVFVAAAAYGSLYALLLAQALGGVPLSAAAGTLAAWAAVTLGAASVVWLRGLRTEQSLPHREALP